MQWSKIQFHEFSTPAVYGDIFLQGKETGVDPRCNLDKAVENLKSQPLPEFKPQPSTP
jgi:hypothetical protein